MSIQDTIENASFQFAKAQEKVIQRLVSEIMELGSGLDRDDLLRVVSSIDIATYMLEELGFKNDIAKLMNSYENLLLDTPFFAEISAGSLEAMEILEQSTYFAHTSQISNSVRLETLKGIIAGKDENSIKNTITNLSGLRKDQAQVLANTSMNNFSRSVIKQQMDQSDPDQKYFYAGVIDDVTRDICLEMGSAGEMTQQEIEDKFGSGVLLDGGGFNCRHQWQPVTSSKGKLSDPENAKNYIDERGSKYNPITMEEMYENKS